MRILHTIILLLTVYLTMSAQTVSKEFPEAGRYMNVPVGTAIFGQVMTVYSDGRLVGRFNMDLQETNPYMYAFIDLGPDADNAVRIDVEHYNGTLDGIFRSDSIEGEEEIYNETKRPHFHFTARRGWFNDPNGMIWHKGKWHLYYQYNPLSIFWANMSWGHAESTDLVHWKEKAPVLYPLPSTGDCFTGSSFVDYDNVLGLNKGKEEAIVAFYLRTGSGLSYAYSLDGGETYADYEGNPIVAKAVGKERIDSPKPIFHEKLGKWVAPVFDDYYDSSQGRNVMTVSIYTSEDLKEWKKQSDIGEIGLDSECPDLFPLYLDGDKDKEYWVLVLGNAAYSVGHFDGKHFIPLASGKPAVKEDFISAIPFGHYYAPSTYANVPDSDGRRIQIAWMKNVFNDSTIFSGMPFNSQMSIPMELSLHSSADGPRLYMYPVKELEKLRGKVLKKGRGVKLSTENLLHGITGSQTEILMTTEGGSFSLDVRGLEISLKDGILSVDGMSAALQPKDDTVELRVLTDTRSVEIYVNGGEMYIPLLHDFKKEDYSLTGDGCTLKSLKIFSLDSIWKR